MRDHYADEKQEALKRKKRNSVKKEKKWSIQEIPPLDIEVEHGHLCLSQAGSLGAVDAGGVLQLKKG
jgi:hypothetical protein